MERITFHQARKNQKVPAGLRSPRVVMGQRPTSEPEDMYEAAQSALRDGLGIGDAMSLIYSHDDEDYAHIHIVALEVHPRYRRAYDLDAARKLSAWALQYEIDHGGVINTRRQTANELRQAIARRDAGSVLEALTKQQCDLHPGAAEARDP